MNSQKNEKAALVVGATGLVGRQLVEELLRSGLYHEVRLLGRQPLGLTHAALRDLRFDFAHPDVALVVGDDVFCCLGTTLKKAGSKEAFYRVDYDYPLEIARIARENGATRYFVVTAMGASASSTFFYNRVKGELEENLQKLGYPTLHVFRPSLLLGARSEKRLGERVGALLMRVLRPLLRGPLLNYRAIDSGRVARAMLAAARQPTAPGVQVHESGQMQAF